MTTPAAPWQEAKLLGAALAVLVTLAGCEPAHLRLPEEADAGRAAPPAKPPVLPPLEKGAAPGENSSGAGVPPDAGITVEPPAPDPVIAVAPDAGAPDTVEPEPAPADAAPAPTSLAAQLLALTRDCARRVGHPYEVEGGGTTSICALDGAIHWSAGMAIDCDGRPTAGKCDEKTDPTFLDDTAFHTRDGAPLESALTPFVVIPGDLRHPGLDTSKGGNVAAVIYQDKVVFAVVGDTGSDDFIGEASHACAKQLGIDPDPDVGGVSGKVVTYIVFTGPSTIPANIEDRVETARLGEQLATELLTARK
jgi:hypothetical protein